MKYLWVIVWVIIILLFFTYSYGSKLLASNSASTEKVIYTDTTNNVHSFSYSIWFIVDSWSNTPKILFQQSRDNIDELIVYFDDYVNNLNIFLPELSNTYNKSKNCKITETPTRELNIREKECETACSQTLCNSYSYEITGTTGTKKRAIDFSFDFEKDSFKGNTAYIDFMKKVDETKNIGKCSLFTASPTMPANCFLEQDKNETEPYSVYDWNSFVYNMDVNSFTLDRFSFHINIQKWTNLIITIDEYIMEVYINGKIEKSVTLVRKKHNRPSKITITPDGYGFNGKTRDFKYWDKCLSSKEIKYLSKKSN